LAFRNGARLRSARFHAASDRLHGGFPSQTRSGTVAAEVQLSSVHIRVLGSLAVEVDGVPVPLGGRRQRALLTLLLIHANRPLPAERLVEELWDEPMPQRAVKRLQVALTRLRRALDAGGVTDVRLVTDPGAYRLQLEPEALDAHVFERLLDEGRRALADGGDVRRAATTLRDALALWRGEPLADVAFESFAQAEIKRLNELHVAALEERAEADLALGRHHELVPELEQLVAGHPLRERLRGQLMLALHRAGRTAHALETYREGRRRLADELGLEPGPALRKLEEAILTSDPSLDLAGARDRPEPVALPPAEERRQVSALVLDLQWADAVERDPERLAAAIDLLAAVGADELDAVGGSLESIAPDGLVAAFGARTGLEDHGQRALRAALAVRDRFGSLFGDALTVRGGVESGEALVARGAGGRFAVTGAPLTVAGRLARQAQPGAIRLGERITAGAARAFVVEAATHGHVLVRARAGDGDARRPSRQLGRTFVGRESELGLLRATFGTVAAQSRPHFATLVGDAGVGKTSTVGAFRSGAGETPARWYVGRCRSYGRMNTYRPLGDVVRACLDLDADDGPELIARRLGERTALHPLLGLPPEEELPAWEAKAKLTQGWIDFVEQLADEGPVAVVIEDVHWAEDPLLELLAVTAREASGPVLLLATARPELLGRTQPWNEGHANISRIRLEPLPPDDAARMLEQLTGGLPPRVRDAMLERAEGNPFFLEEILQSWVDRGALRRTERGAAATDLPRRVAVPETVQDVIAARIDLLPPLEKHALQAAAVIGRAFWEGAVRELVDAASPSFGLLEERDFVRRRRRSTLEGEREHLFKHELTRDVAYRSLTISRRARMHAGFAQWLERRDTGAGGHAALLAHHYAEAVAPEAAELAWGGDSGTLAGLRASAIRWLRRAAELAQARHEMNDAAALFRQAATLEPDERARAELWRAVASASEQAFGMDDFRAALEQVIELTPAGPERARLYSELAYRGANQGSWTDPPTRETVEGWIARALAEGGSDPAVRGRTLIARTGLDPANTAPAAEETLAIARQHGYGWLLGPAYRQLALCATASGDLEGARRWVDEECALPPEVADRSERTLWLLDATFTYLRLGRVGEAQRFARAHAEMANRLSPHHHMHAVGATLLTRTVIGRWEEAAGLVPGIEAASIANADTLCDMNWRTLLMAALAMARLGDKKEARRLEELAAALVPPHASLAQEPAFLRLLLLRGDLVTARQALAADPGPYPWTDVDYAPARLDGLAAVGDRDGVEREAPHLLRAGGFGEPFALRALGRARGDRSLVDQAVARFATMGLDWYAHDTLATRHAPA
jgi:DNA-binding SARP family transcriptional activator